MATKNNAQQQDEESAESALQNFADKVQQNLCTQIVIFRLDKNKREFCHNVEHHEFAAFFRDVYTYIAANIGKGSFFMQGRLPNSSQVIGGATVHIAVDKRPLANTPQYTTNAPIIGHNTGNDNTAVLIAMMQTQAQQNMVILQGMFALLGNMHGGGGSIREFKDALKLGMEFAQNKESGSLGTEFLRTVRELGAAALKVPMAAALPPSTKRGADSIGQPTDVQEILTGDDFRILADTYAKAFRSKFDGSRTLDAIKDALGVPKYNYVVSHLTECVQSCANYIAELVPEALQDSGDAFNESLLQAIYERHGIRYE